MRLNKFIARHSGISRREADDHILAGRVAVNGEPARLGQKITEFDVVTLNGNRLNEQRLIYLMMHKPVGYVCSRSGQGANTVYQLLPKKYQNLKTVGRLDKDTSGLILLTNDGDFTQRMTHPSHHKIKRYEVALDRALSQDDLNAISTGVELEDGPSALRFISVKNATEFVIEMSEGRNRQIRRTFAALGYNVVGLHRIAFDQYELGDLKAGQFYEVPPPL